MNLHQKEEWDDTPQAAYRKRSIDWLTTFVYLAIAAAFALSCLAFKCGHGVMLLGLWVLLGGLWLVYDAPERRFWRALATVVAGIVAIIGGAVMMGVGA